MRLKTITSVSLTSLVVLAVIIIGFHGTLGLLQVSYGITSYGTIGQLSLGWLHTDGKYIKNALGEIVWLKGTAWVEYEWGPKDYSDPVLRADMMKQYGVNVVRLCLNPAFWLDPSRGQYNGYKEKIDQLVNLLNERNIYLVMDFHKLGDTFDPAIHSVQYMLNPESVSVDDKTYNITDFWVQLARRYVDKQNVAIFELVGQPPHDWNRTRWDIWWNNALYLARTIHAINPHMVVAVASMVSDRITQNFVNNPLPEPNIIYKFHKYYHFDIGWSDYANNYANGNLELAKQQQESFYYNIVGLKMLDKGYPVIAMEIGARIDDPYWDVQIRDLYELFAKYKVPWVQWVWMTRSWGSNQFGLVEDDWVSLSPQGELWKTELES